MGRYCGNRFSATRHSAQRCSAHDQCSSAHARHARSHILAGLALLRSLRLSGRFPARPGPASCIGEKASHEQTRSGVASGRALYPPLLFFEVYMKDSRIPDPVLTAKPERTRIIRAYREHLGYSVEDLAVACWLA